VTSKPFTDKQKAFIREYLVDKCGAKAAVRAGYAPAQARKTACELLKKPEIRKAVDAALDKQAERTLLTADAVLLRLQTLSEKAEIAGEFTPAIRATIAIGQHYKLFTEKHEHGGIGGGPVQMVISDREADL
jgi:phage terminase small subunit